MSWRIDISKNGEKFLAKNEFTIDELRELIGKAIQNLQGEGVTNVDIKKLRGSWSGYYRIRSGKVRIIAEFDFDNSVVFIEEIDWRGNVY